MIEKPPKGYVDDVSRLNKTQVSEVWDIPSDPQKGISELRKLLQKARANHLPVSITGARHSMGGQTIYPGGISVNMIPFKNIEIDEVKNLLHVQAGRSGPTLSLTQTSMVARSAFMQSDNSFTVGGSLSVNCHGWQYDRPPVASTVESST